MLKGLFFSLPSLCFRLVVKMRNWLYDVGIFKEIKANLPVVSIGNVVVGGSGKTPFVYMLAKELAPQTKVAILSRGYGGKRKKEPLLVSFGTGPLVSPKLAGDEPYLLADRLPGVIVVVGKSRLKAAEVAQKAGAELLILDDGMQHRKIARDFEIVVVGHASKRFLPWGRLRDQPRRIESADLVVFNGAHEETKVLSVRVKRGEPKVIFPGEKPSKLKQVALFSGIGNPKSFVEVVEGLGLTISLSLTLRDHQKIEEKQLNCLITQAQRTGCDAVLCTEKDYVKIANSKLNFPVGFVRADFEIADTQDEWAKFLNKIKQRLSQ